MADLEYELNIAYAQAAQGDLNETPAVVSRLKTLDLRGEVPAVEYLVLELIGCVRLGDRSRAMELSSEIFASGVPRGRMREILYGVPESAHQGCRDFITALTEVPKPIVRSAPPAPVRAVPAPRPIPPPAGPPKRFSTAVLIILIICVTLLLAFLIFVLFSAFIWVASPPGSF